MSKRKPNIILLVLDTHRAGRMSAYGYHKPTTPVLDEMAERSTLFDWAIAPGQWTIPSHASMFSGLYPTIHQTNQSFSTLPDTIPTIAELLSKNGYETVGFCNNPLVGVLDNGLKRGFNQFYNYGATFPDVPHVGDEQGLRALRRKATELIKNISTPIEQQFGRSPLLLKLATMPIFVPLWTQLINFKGNTQQSLRDIADYLRYYHATKSETPLFMFINMMETHLPYHPPPGVIDRWVPYLRKDREARQFLQRFNTESYRWMAPLVEPMSDMQKQVLSDVYDSEVAYQDRQLQRVFRYLKRSGQLENTMVIVVSDHGESHGEHNFMGHAFVIYNELVRVPMMIHYPEIYPGNTRIEHPVSTRRVFHTIMEAAGVDYEALGQPAKDLSLSRSLKGRDGEPQGEEILSEAYPPQNFINVMEMSNPEAIERFKVRAVRRAIYGDGVKLMTLDDRPDEFFDYRKDIGEGDNLLDHLTGYENALIGMEQRLESYVDVLKAYRDGTTAGAHKDYSNNPELLERLRGLGYIE